MLCRWVVFPVVGACRAHREHRQHPTFFASFTAVGPFPSGREAFHAYVNRIEAFLAHATCQDNAARTASCHSIPPSSPCRSFEAALAPLVRDDGLPFADVLPAEQIQQACRDEGVHFGATSRSVYTPAVVLWAFLSQVLRFDKSCRAAALRVVVLSVVLERGPCSADTGRYCRARVKLPAALLRRLTYAVADQLEQAVPEQWLWKGRQVQLVDGTTMTLPDTAANQAAYPQPPRKSRVWASP